MFHFSKHQSKHDVDVANCSCCCARGDDVVGHHRFQFDEECVTTCLFTVLRKSAAVCGCRGVKLDAGPSSLISHTLTPSYPRVTFTVQPLHLPHRLVPPRRLQSVKSPSVSPPLPLSIQLHLFLRAPLAVTAPSHVCQSQLAHLLLHTHTHTPASQM